MFAVLMNWTPAEIQHLKDNHGKRDLYLLAWDLRRSEVAVKRKLWDLMQTKKK